MIYDLQRDVPDAARHADVCIVGAGAAGIALAVECVRQGKSVTLLEAGGTTAEAGAQDTFRGAVVARAYRGMEQGRAKRLGGTTTLWGGQILELDAIDFEHRDWVAGSGWPVTKQELAPFYARALALEGVTPALQDDAGVWRRLGLDAPVFDDLDAYFSRWCPEPDFSRLHRSALQGEGVTLWLHATAVQAVCEGEHLRHIVARTACGRRASFKADRFVFCLGSIETARFFLQPREGVPWRDSSLIGHFFQDHIDSTAATLVPHDAASLHTLFDTVFLRGFKYSPKLRLSDKVQRRHKLLNVGATIFSTEAADDSLRDLKATAKGVLRGRLDTVRPSHLRGALRSAPHLARQAYRYAVQHRAYHSPKAALSLRVHCEQLPAGHNAITLTNERDALGLLRARVRWQIEPDELRSIRCFVELCRGALSRYADVVPHPALHAGDGSFADHCEDSFHHMGGMRMDPSPECGVVDEELRIHGTSNAYVCSAAVFPTSGFSNPTHTLLALAARLALHLS